MVCLGRAPHKKWWELDLDENDHIQVERSIELTDMTAFKDKPVDTLSGGQRQRAFLSLALAQDAKTLLFDEPTKYCAKLRDFKTDNNLLLFKCEMDAGHGSRSGRKNIIEDIAFDYAFALKIANKI